MAGFSDEVARMAGVVVLEVMGAFRLRTSSAQLTVVGEQRLLSWRRD